MTNSLSDFSLKRKDTDTQSQLPSLIRKFLEGNNVILKTFKSKSRSKLMEYNFIIQYRLKINVSSLKPVARCEEYYQRSQAIITTIYI